jgi:hypothetical protein
MQIYKTTNAFYLLFYVAAHTTQTTDDISCVAYVQSTRPASLVPRSLVFCIWFCLQYIFYVVTLIFLYFHKY